MTTDNSRADALTYEQVEALAAKHQFDMSTFDFTDSNSLVDLVNDAIRLFRPVEQHEAAPAHYTSDGGSCLNCGSALIDHIGGRVCPQSAQPEPPAADERAAFDILAHLQRQREFSERTFGPGARTAGVCDHIRKELKEIEGNPGDLTEWIDVVILALDGAWRAGGSPQQIVDALVAKQTKNEGRTWPDWRTVPADKAIEHERSHDVCPQCQGKGTVVFRDPEEAWDVTCGVCDGSGQARASSPNAAGATEASEEFRQMALSDLYEFQELTGCSSAAEYREKLSRAPRTDVAGGVAAKPVDAKARMDWAESILKNLPEHEPTYAIINLLNDYDPDERDEILHSIRAYADGRATLALFTQYVPPQPPSADAAAAPADAQAVEAVAWQVVWPGKEKTETWHSVFVNERDALQSASNHEGAEVTPLYAAPPPPAPASAPVDVERMLRACVPGGDIVDPQLVCDNIREWFDEHRAQASAPVGLTSEQRDVLGGNFGALEQAEDLCRATGNDSSADGLNALSYALRALLKGDKQ